MALMMVGSSLVPLVLVTAFKKKGSGLPACLARSSYFSRPVACSRGAGPTKPRASREAIGIVYLLKCYTQ